MDESALPADYQAIMKIVTAASEPVPAKDVSVQLGRGTGPGQVEPVRHKLRRLANRGWLHRPPGRPLHYPAAASRMTDLGRISE